MRRSFLIITLTVLLLGVLVAGGFYYLYRNSPRYALIQMTNSLTIRNYEKFYQYLDLKSILSHLVQETGKDFLLQEEGKGDALNRLGLSLGRKLAQQLLPQLFESFEKDLRKLINEYLRTLTTQELLALETAVALAEIRQQGEEAQVILRFPKDEGRLRLFMSRNFPDRSWRVISVNYEDLKRLLKKELL